MYKTGELRSYFGVTRQTISIWCREFADYLSPNANPTDNSRRSLNDDDFRVLSLIAEMTGDGKTYDAIHLALAAGQRGDLMMPTEDTSIVPVEQRIQSFVSRITELESRLRQAEMDRAGALGQLTQANAEITSLKKEVRDLYREVFNLEAQIPRTPND